MRPAEAHGNAEALGRAHRDVGAEGSGRCEQEQGEQIRGDRDLDARGVGLGAQGGVVGGIAEGIGILEEHAEYAYRSGAGSDGGLVAHAQLDADGFRPGAQHVDGLGMAAVGHEEGLGRFVLAQAEEHGHGLGRGGAFIQQGGVGDFHAGEVEDGGLEVDEGFQATLGDFRLVGRVGRVPVRDSPGCCAG